MNQTNNHRSSHRWVVFAILSTVYFFVYFHRVSTSVIAHQLMAAFKTNATALGFMSSMYFYMYAIEQPVVGYLSDRLGPRRVVGYWSLVAATGSIIFGFAPSIGWACVGRAIIGFGVGGVYVPAMKAVSQWFDHRDFATLTGLLLAIGNLGAVVATTPLAWMATTFGWRSSFLIIGAITYGLALATFFFTRDVPSPSPLTRDSHTRDKTEKVLSRQQLFMILISIRFWILAFIFAGFFGTTLTFQGLWATPYLVAVYKMEEMKASGLNMLIPVGFMVGAPIFGRLADRIFHEGIYMLITSLLIESLIWVFITYGWELTGPGGMGILLFIMGAFAGAFATSIWALVNETNPKELLGSVSGLLNSSPFVGVALVQVLTGYLMDRVGKIAGSYPPEAFKQAFIACLFISILCLALCWIFKKLLNRP